MSWTWEGLQHAVYFFFPSSTIIFTFVLVLCLYFFNLDIDLVDYYAISSSLSGHITSTCGRSDVATSAASLFEMRIAQKPSGMLQVLTLHGLAD